MIRNVSLEAISDGRLYGLNDMVKADCGDCRGCSACCHGMGASIVLDPLDVHRLVTNLYQSFENLLEEKLELNVVDGIILPNLKLGGAEEVCVFLGGDERCSIHSIRPGICRLFPLGRYYEGEGFQYFLQIHECPRPARTKVKVRKWIDMPNPVDYDRYILAWHQFQKDLQEGIKKEPEIAQQVSMYVLKQFYIAPYADTTDFYETFYGRLREARGLLGIEKTT